MTQSMIPIVFGVVGLAIAMFIYQIMKKHPAGEGKVLEIAAAIHLGAMVFMKREYSILAIFVAVVAALLAMSLGMQTTVAFLVGAACSALAGYLGMFAATKANVRTATAAQNEGASAALSVAFYGGSIMGIIVASLGLLGLGTLYLFFGGDPETAHAIHGFGMGASSVALFSRVGGGIFTKSADV
ncbi:MAG: sodium/proton-translocating pyrophosphatase, partial [Mariprofundaceae bacterium]